MVYYQFYRDCGLLELKPLSENEQNNYIETFQNKDLDLETRTQAKNILIEHNVKLAIAIINKLCVSLSDEDKKELLSIATDTTLPNVIKRFNPSKGYAFSTYYTHAFKNDLIKYKRKMKLENIPSLDHVLFTTDKGEEITVGSKLSVNYNFIENIEMQEMAKMLENAMKCLTERECTMVKYHYGFDCESLTLEEIGNIYNLSRQRVSQIIIKANEKMKTYIQNGSKNNLENIEKQERAMRFSTEREREIIKLYHGFDCEKLTQEKIGEIYNCTKSNISLIIKRANKKIETAYLLEEQCIQNGCNQTLDECVQKKCKKKLKQCTSTIMELQSITAIGKTIKKKKSSAKKKCK